MGLTHKEIYERYVYAGAITRNPAAVAALFTEDGVYEAPLVPDSHPLHRLVGHDEIRAGTAAYHEHMAPPGVVDPQESAYVLHDTPDPGAFIVEIDVTFEQADGRRTTMSLVQIFRLRDDRIALLRDYFADPDGVATARDHSAELDGDGPVGA